MRSSFRYQKIITHIGIPIKLKLTIVGAVSEARRIQNYDFQEHLSQRSTGTEVKELKKSRRVRTRKHHFFPFRHDVDEYKDLLAPYQIYHHSHKQPVDIQCLINSLKILGLDGSKVDFLNQIVQSYLITRDLSRISNLMKINIQATVHSFRDFKHDAAKGSLT